MQLSHEPLPLNAILDQVSKGSSSRSNLLLFLFPSAWSPAPSLAQRSWRLGEMVARMFQQVIRLLRLPRQLPQLR